MFRKVLKCLVYLFPVFLNCQAFWWRSSSTEAPPQPLAVKQIPLTYFRTYTYQQPLASNPMQLPMLSSSDYITNYNALSSTPYFNPMIPMVPMSLTANNEIPIETRPGKNYGNFNLVRSLGPQPVATTSTPKSTTTTTTTTTTTPEPTTTTTTTEMPTTAQIDLSSSSNPLMPAESLNAIEASYPAFNRKAFTNHFNINYNRPVYPYPEYSAYKTNSPNNNENNHAIPNIEFVHCMCPINIPNTGFSSSYQIAGNPSNSILLAQGRTSVEAETSVDMPSSNVELTPGAEASNLLDDIRQVKLNVDEDAVQATLT